MTSFCQFSALVQKGKSDLRSAFYVSQEEGMYNWAQIPGIGNRMFFFFFYFYYHDNFFTYLETGTYLQF